MEPSELSAVEAAFSASVRALMPAWDDIPKDFQQSRTAWNDLANRWFCRGLRDAEFIAKDGINKDAALRHLKTVLGSFEPSHEHKEATVAYLLSLWFDRVVVGKDVYR